MRDREHWADQHPPTCSCDECTEAREHGMTRTRYLLFKEQRRKQTEELTSENVEAAVSDLLRADRKRIADKEHIAEIIDRLAKGETIQVSGSEPDSSYSQQDVVDSQARPFGSKLRRRRTLWKRMFGRGRKRR